MHNLHHNDQNEWIDPAQQEAIRHVCGPMLLIAGPGSGKTRVITNRIRYLIEEKHILPNHILVITFTNAAAEEMRQRSLLTCSGSAGACFGTFHSIFFHILKQTAQFKEFSLLDTKEAYRLFLSICRLYGISSMDESFCYSLFQLMSYCKNADLSYESLLLDEKEDVWQQVHFVALSLKEKERAVKILLAFREECLSLHKLDFDDMILFCKQMLTKNDSFRLKWSERFSYIMIDEFQDISRLQYDVIRLLASDKKNVFAVGDDDQSIYGFRGATPDFMRTFAKDFDPCKKVYLSVNYRSHQDIVKAAAKLISYNRNRFDKRIQAREVKNGEVKFFAFGCQEEENHFLCQGVVKVICQGQGEVPIEQKTGEQQSIAVLCRTNREVAYYKKELAAEKALAGKIRAREKADMGYDREVVLDIIAILYMALGRRERKYFYRFMNKPPRGIHRISVEDPVSFDNLLKRYQDDETVWANIGELVRKMELLETMDTYGAIIFICHILGYENYMNSLEEEKRQKAHVTMQRLKEVAKKYTEIEVFLQGLEQDMDFMLAKDECKVDKGKQEKNRSDQKSRVEIMTYHASKGLEFDHVFLPGVREGRVPFGRNLSEGMLEEERRMFYVAMTRAKKSLYISYVEDAQAKECVSVFIRELTQGIGKLAISEDDYNSSSNST